MEKTDVALTDLPLGVQGRVQYLTTQGQERRRLQDLGFIPGSLVTALQASPAGDPVAYLIRGAVIALRCEDAAKIFTTII